jgi:chromosome segregation ATPase
MHMAEAERRINQVKNDVDEIYGRLGVIGKVQAEHTKQLGNLNDTVAKIWTTQQQHGDRLNDLDAALAGLDEKLTEMRVTQLGHESRFTKIDNRFAQIDNRFAQIDQRFEKIDQRFEKIDQRFEKIDQRFEKIDQRFEKIDERLVTQDKKLDLIMKALNIGAN